MIGKREEIRVKDGASFEKAAGGGKPLVNCKGIRCEEVLSLRADFRGRVGGNPGIEEC